jgi:hypothetical protein
MLNLEHLRAFTAERIDKGGSRYDHTLQPTVQNFGTARLHAVHYPIEHPLNIHPQNEDECWLRVVNERFQDPKATYAAA